METTASPSTSVVLVEDSPAIRVRLAAMLNAIPGVAVVGEAETPASAVEAILRVHPDAVLLDIQLLGGSGIEVLRRVRQAEPRTLFIVLTNSTDVRYRKLYMDAGADHFLDKTTEFTTAVELVASLATH